jgi:hypothetical protein
VGDVKDKGREADHQKLPDDIHACRPEPATTTSPPSAEPLEVSNISAFSAGWVDDGIIADDEVEDTGDVFGRIGGSAIRFSWVRLVHE